MGYDSEGTTKVLYEPKTNYKIDRIEVMIDKSNHFISKVQMRSLSIKYKGSVNGESEFAGSIT
jgi:hypothetical protein